MNERLVPEIRRALTELADATPPAPPLDELLARRHEPRPPRRPKLFTVAAVGVSLTAAIVGLVLINERVDRDTPTSPSTITPTVTTATTAVPRAIGPPDAALATGFEPASITWISLQQGWLLGHAPCAAGTCLSLARTRDGGRTWHGVPPPAPASTWTTAGVRFADDHNGWIFGIDVSATHDGGSTWTKVDGLYGVDNLEVAKGRAWAEVAMTVSGDVKNVYTSSVTSDDWHAIGDMAVSTPITMHGGAGYVVGPDGGLFVVTASGFDIRTDPCSIENSIGAIAPVDNETVAVVCGSLAGAGSESKQVNLSHDGGQTYTAVGEAPRSGIMTSAAAASPATFVIAAISGASYLYRSTDGGATWKTVFQDNSGGAPLRDLGFTDANHGVAVLGTQPSALLTTTDGGATWTKTAIHD